MKKLLFRKFLKDTLKFFAIILFTFGFIVWVIQAVNFLDFVTEDGHSLYVYFFYSIYNFPKIIHRILPFAFFISLFYQLNQYELRNELLIFWTNGINKLHFIKMIIVFSLLFLIIELILGGLITPKTQDKARSFIRNSNIDFFPSLIKEGKFIIDNKTCSIFYEKIIRSKFNIINKNDPIYKLKSIKNSCEIKHMINAHKHDGLALTKFIYWIKNINKKKIRSGCSK